jgi:FkbM family methyltransferase
MYRRHAALIHLINQWAPQVSFELDGKHPCIRIEPEKLRLCGLATDQDNADLFHALRPMLSANVRTEYFRLIKDFVTRWLYPHMRPDCAPEGYDLDGLHGMHGQHKDSIRDIPDAAARDRLVRAFRPGAEDVVIDCGAFLGFGAIRMGRDVRRGRVLAIEASEECHALLSQNVEINGAANVTPIHKGIWKAECEIPLEKTHAQGNSLFREVQVGTRQETINTATIDGLVNEFKLGRVDMLSLTLNGAEPEALEGATATLTRLRPRIRAAGWYSRDGQKIGDVIKPQLERFDYDVFVGPRHNVMALPRELR